MAKKNKVSVDDFSFEEDEKSPPMKTIAQTVQRTTAKVEPNISQSEVKLQPEVEPNIGQSEVKVEPAKEVNLKPEPKLKPQPEPKPEPIMSQTTAKVEPNGRLESLVGLQRNCLVFIFESCLLLGSRVSSPIAISNLAKSVETTMAAVRKAIQRLEEKGFLFRAEYKDGRGGWTKYEVPQLVYNQLLSEKSKAKVESKLSQTTAKVGTELEPQLEPKAPYSSSYSLEKNTNTAIHIPENLKPFGISGMNLQKLIENNIASFETVEASLAALSYDVAKGKKGSLAKILFGILNTGREYVSEGYSQAIQKELQEELARIQKTEEAKKALKEAQLRAKFNEYINSEPDFLNSVRERNKMVSSVEIIERIAFEEFSQMFPDL